MTAAPGGTGGAVVDARLVEVAEQVYVYEQLPGGWCVSNSGVLTGAEGALVVDTLATVGRAERLREAVDRLRPGPARTLVNTHHHGDHTFGNQVFGPGATVVAHERTRAGMVSTGLALTGLWPQVEWGEVRLSLPTLTFRDRLTVHLGERRVELFSVAPAHTDGDVVVWLPDERVLFAGDVVFSGAAPFCLFGTVAGTLRAIERLRALRPRTVVSGHGPVTGPEVLDDNARYVRWIQELAEAGAARGLTPLETARSANREEFGHLLDAERIVGNLHVAYAELARPAGSDAPGRAAAAGPQPPLDPLAVFHEMVAFNGGHLPTCLA
ncbi:MBL fold metallo-hydrolase [Streptomyces luteolus]|uniref:MBL fold metallo-hydrolase n=1 Tax=Streptomyces luteolus TaxID=3043615 RepID=A0ABT6T6W9_9ACTN|nr:MBL fold metallo-hydrolase [Streptomyces sp. B-S-A12]MDI3422622.1 MBL fold metallo-hydrolase [Streptomyces sp. B-S-A12]